MKRSSSSKKKKILIPVAFMLSMLMTNNIYAENQKTAADSLSEISVTTVKEKLDRAGTVKDVIEKTEVVTKKQIENKGAFTLSEAVNNEPGVQSATGCSVCGLKRIRLNGMKGEYTTTLVDGVPLHSTVSGYYGSDAQTTAGISSIEVSRGAGASLTAPGAIGGVINIKTKEPKKNGISIAAGAGNVGSKTLSAIATGVSKDKKTRLMISSQYNEHAQFDGDKNGISESPALLNLSLSTKIFHDITENDEINVIANKYHSEVYGGYVTDRHYWAIGGGDNQSQDIKFVDGDVNKKYLGGPYGIGEAVQTDRLEGIASWRRIFNDKINMKITGSGAQQIQKSMYEGTDYYNKDNTEYGLVKVNTLLTESNLLTIGSDTKVEQMNAKSKAFWTKAENGDIITPDDFDYMSIAGFLQDVWTPSDIIEVSGAIRLDKITTNWVYQTKVKNELDKFMIAPRLHVRVTPIEALNIRLSGGRGYRAPLSFFESNHGLAETGYDIKIDNLEDSWGGNASLSLDLGRFTTTASYAYTKVNNLSAYQDINGRNTLTNNKEPVSAQDMDIVAGYNFTNWFTLGTSYEHLIYDKEYKATINLPAIEDRAKVMLDFAFNNIGTEIHTTGTIVGPRDLTEYGLGGLYNIYTDAGPSDPKDTNVPAYFTLDTRISQKLSKKFSLYVSGKNLTDYTQVGKEKSTPLFWDNEGGCDVVYLWGPLRGREISAGVQIKL